MADQTPDPTQRWAEIEDELQALSEVRELCDPDCYGRCSLCPLTAVEALKSSIPRARDAERQQHQEELGIALQAQRAIATHLACWRCGTAAYQPNERCDSHISWADRLQAEIEHHNAWRKRADEAEREVVQHQQTIQHLRDAVEGLLALIKGETSETVDVERAIEALGDQSNTHLRATIQQQAAQIATLTQALREALSFMPDVTAYQRERRRIVAAALAGASRPTTGCELDTDGDGNCPVHPQGCPTEGKQGALQ